MEHILFIGNSHTYYNDMPDIFRRLCRHNGREVFTVMLAHGGVGLDFHAHEPEAAHNIRYGKFDCVVLQHKANPYERDTMFCEGMRLAGFIKGSGAKGVVYMPWPRLEARDTQEIALEGNSEFARQNGFALAPAGMAWWKFMDEHPEVEMFRPDHEHATKKGSFLAACVIYCAVYGERPKTDGEELHELMAQAAFEAYEKYKV